MLPKPKQSIMLNICLFFLTVKKTKKQWNLKRKAANPYISGATMSKCLVFAQINNLND